MKKIFSKKKKSLDIKRYYVPKLDEQGRIKKDAEGNEKWRPIGAPKPASKAVMQGISKAIYSIFEYDIGDYQYGFMPGKDPRSMIVEIAYKLSTQNLHVYQYDLKSFFNTVDVGLVCRYIDECIPTLGG